MNTDQARERWALVTGASAGIGTAFARDLAARGFNVVLVARRAERLNQLGAELEDQHGIKTLVAAVDLSQGGARERLFKATEAQNIQIEMLVNNAGFGIDKGYTEQELDDQAAMLQVLVTTVAQTCRLYLPGMVARGHGRIINVASMAGVMPTIIGQSLYGACKSFVIKLSENLHLEYGDKGINVTAVCPGLTRTEFFGPANMEDDVKDVGDFAWSEPEEIAALGIEAVTAGEPLALPKGFYRTYARIVGLLPRWVQYWMVRKFNKTASGTNPH